MGQQEAFKIPPAGRVVRLGNVLDRHLYRIDVGGGWHIEVDANSSSQAASIATREGYEVRGVNKIA